MAAPAAPGKLFDLAGAPSVSASVSCAALTGLQFDRAEISERGYSRLRRHVLDTLVGPDHAQDVPTEAAAALFGAARQRGVSSISVPLVRVRRPQVREQAVTIVESISQSLDGCTLALADHSENLYDFGVATLDLDLTISMDPGVDAERTRQLSQDLRGCVERDARPLVEAMTEAFQDAMTQLDGARRSTATLLHESGILGFGDPSEAEEMGIGSLLWIHTVYLVGLEDSTSIPLVHDQLAELLPSFSRRVDLPGAVLSPGLQVSVGVYDTRSAAGADCSQALRTVVGDLNAWWTAIWHVDHLLFRFLSEIRSRRRVETHRGLRDQAQAIEELHDHVTLLRALMESFTLNLAGRERGLWDEGSSLWWLDANMAAVASKLEALRTFHSSIAEELQRRSSRRLEMLLALFTVFGAVGSVAGVAAFLWPGETDMGTLWRAVLMASTTGVALAFFTLVVWVRPKYRSRGLRQRRRVPRESPLG